MTASQRHPAKRIPTRPLAGVLLGLLLLASATTRSTGDDDRADSPGRVVRVSRKPDPYGVPRPGPGEAHVPLATSFYVELGVEGGVDDDRVDPGTVSLTLHPEQGRPFLVLQAGQRFAEGFHGRFFPGKKGRHGDETLAMYVETDAPLNPSTRYTVHLDARSRQGATMADAGRHWQFTTEAEAGVHALRFALDLDDRSLSTDWQGGFFSGFCGTSFATNHKHRIPTFEAMDQVRQWSPRAWSLQRDFWLTGMDRQPRLLSQRLPGIVREQETRRIVMIQPQGDRMRLQLEDFFGHQQYGIASNRPLDGDYRPGDQVLIADGVHDALAQVISVDDATRSIMVTGFDTPEGGWRLDYSAALPEQEDPDSPGFFPPGGCHLIKFQPVGTPRYYWGRLDHEWDLAIRRFDRRVMVNFTDAPGDLSIDGRNWTTAKDYAQLHQVVHAITTHLIQRYGDRCLDFPWSVFNEPDLGALFWRSDWIELQKFYDYTVDAILRAFEDQGYDSDQVFIGGLELGAIFGTNLRLREFLVHCSPTAGEVKGALMFNAAYADSRLDGKRSRRVDSLCREHGGRGTPCDFISIHAYNTSSLMAEKLIRAKQMALEIDPDYYAGLWINSHESCPGWDMPPDPAFSDSYLGNGYYPTWCADVTRRRLAQAVVDPRYGYGETILTFWPWPARGFEGRNDCVREVPVDDTGDGQTDRTVTLPMPILPFLGLLNKMQDRFVVLPEQVVEGHVISGFASQVDSRWYVLIYSHQMLDTQSRSSRRFDVSLNLQGLSPERYTVREYRFDRQHHSYFESGRRLRDQPDPRLDPPPEVRERFLAAVRQLESEDRATRAAAMDEIERSEVAGDWAFRPLLEYFQRHEQSELLDRAVQWAQRVSAPRAYPAAEIAEFERRVQLQPTRELQHEVDGQRRLQLSIPLDGNAASFLKIEPAADP